MATAILDGNYLLHRTMHVPQLRMLSTKDKKPSGALFGFIKSLRSTVRYFSEVRRVVAVFDGGRSARRKMLYDNYKNRVKNEDVDPDGLSYMQKFMMQMNYLKFILPRLGVKYVKLPGREADDIIGLICRRPGDDLKVVVSDDKDMLQLVDEYVHVWRPMAEERIVPQNFEVMADCKKDHWLLRKAVLGDPSDKIPGVKGVGSHTIDTLIEDMGGSIGEYPYEDFFACALNHTSKRIRAIGENFEIVVRNMELLDLKREEFKDEEYATVISMCDEEAKFDVLAVRRIFTAFEFFSLVEDFSSWITPFQSLR